MTVGQVQYIPHETQNPTHCRECGHELHDAWEGEQHRSGRHHYRTWTPADAEREIAAARKPRDGWSKI